MTETVATTPSAKDRILQTSRLATLIVNAPPAPKPLSMEAFEATKACVAKGADIELKGARRMGVTIAGTGLDWAANSGQVDLVRYLIEQGGKVDGDGQRSIPLLTICSLQDSLLTDGHIECAKMLLENGANPLITLDGQKRSGKPPNAFDLLENMNNTFLEGKKEAQLRRAAIKELITEAITLRPAPSVADNIIGRHTGDVAARAAAPSERTIR